MYNKTDWKDQKVERQRTYDFSQNEDGTYKILDAFGYVTELGTPVNASNMNHIEEGIYNNSLNIEGHETRIKKLEDEQKLMDSDFIHQSKSLETGVVSDNPLVYAGILSYVNSSFDLSKFTIVGSPVVTNEGIMTKTSQECGFREYINLPLSSKIVIKEKIQFLGGDSGAEFFNQLTFSGADTSNGYIRLIKDYNSGSINGELSYGDSATVIYPTIAALNISAGDWIDFEIIIDKGVVTINAQDITNGNTSTYTNSDIIGTSTTFATIQSYILYQNYGLVSFDLKSFSIASDDIVVFQGNKTGVDLVKKDDYTIVDPYDKIDITEGILSSSNTRQYDQSTTYITMPVSVKGNFSINCRFFGSYLASTTAGRGLFSLWNKDRDKFISFYAIWNGKGLSLGIGHTENNGQSAVYDERFVIQETSGTTFYGWHTINLKYENGNVTITIDNNETYQKTFDESFLADEYTLLDFGSAVLGQCIYNDFKIDLNNSNLINEEGTIYLPCLYVPYIKSKTGSKITDVSYRNAINSIYYINGYAPYYTIDKENQNFTLPMGEIYGMIGKNADNIEENTDNIKELDDNKADIDLSNLTLEGRKTGGSLSFPSTLYDELTLGANNTIYTAPEDGWFAVHCVPQNGYASFRFNNETRGYSANFGYINNSGVQIAGVFPVSKGDNVSILYGYIVQASTVLRFYYDRA